MGEFTVFLRGHAIDVKVTRAFVQKPLGRKADSDDDWYGYSELEFDVLAVWDDEDERMTDSDSEEYAESNHDEISDMIWSELEKDNG